MFILTGEFAVIQSLSNSFSNSMSFFPKKSVLVIRSFKGTIVISIEYSQPSIQIVVYIFLTLKFPVIQFSSVPSFKVFQNTSVRETNLSK